MLIQILSNDQIKTIYSDWLDKTNNDINYSLQDFSKRWELTPDAISRIFKMARLIQFNEAKQKAITNKF